MGLSSNARLLALTARLTSNEYESQQISNSKMRLATQSQEASQAYLDALNDESLVFMGYTAEGHETSNILTASLLYTFGDTKNQYGIVNASGQLLIDKKNATIFQNSATLDQFLEKNGVDKVWKDKTVQKYYEMLCSDEYQGYLSTWQDIVCKDVENANYDVTVDMLNSDSGVIEETVDSDEAWKLTYRSSYKRLQDLVDYYNYVSDNTKTYLEDLNKDSDFIAGYGFGTTYETSYIPAVKQSPVGLSLLKNSEISIHKLEYSGENNLDNFEDDHAYLPEYLYLYDLQHDDKYDEIKQFMNDLYVQIKNQEDKCRRLESKDNWIEDIAKKLAIPKSGIPDDTADEKRMGKYDLARGNSTSTAYQNYQKYLQLDADLTALLEEYDASIENPTNCFTYSDQSKFKWYTNLWYKMNGESTRKSTEGISQNNYKVLDSNLLQSSSWLQDSLQNGTVTIELASNYENLTMADLFQVANVNTYPNELVLKNISWKSKIYTSCSDITTVQDKTKIARAEAEYQKRTQEISKKDQRYQSKLRQLETEHSAIQTEFESVQQALEKNIERSYKTFNG